MQDIVDDFPSCQLIIIDMNHSRWQERADSNDQELISYDDLVRLTCLFSAAHVAMHRMNTFCVVSSHASNTKVLYSSNPSILNGKTELAEELISGFQAPSNPELNIGSLAQSLSLTLCGMSLYLLNIHFMVLLVTNRKLMDTPKSQCKILVMQLSPDSPSTYNSMMNSIFRSHALLHSVFCSLNNQYLLI
jgi:hypothetical protein